MRRKRVNNINEEDIKKEDIDFSMPSKPIDSETFEQALKILKSWFNEHNQCYWSAKNDDFDSRIDKQFSDTLQSAEAGECADWRVTLKGRLAEIIVPDQFSRNLSENHRKLLRKTVWRWYYHKQL